MKSLKITEVLFLIVVFFFSLWSWRTPTISENGSTLKLTKAHDKFVWLATVVNWVRSFHHNVKLRLSKFTTVCVCVCECEANPELVLFGKELPLFVAGTPGCWFTRKGKAFDWTPRCQGSTKGTQKVHSEVSTHIAVVLLSCRMWDFWRFEKKAM